MAETYQLDKTVWTDSDFEQMRWHDNPIHAISFNDDFELLLDIDYIFRWLPYGKKHFKFWIAPCTLIFENVYDIEFESEYKQLIIDYVSRQDPQKPKNAEHIGRDLEYDWNIVMVNAEMWFKSVGYKMFVRREPILCFNQKLQDKERGGISFEKTYEILKTS